MFAAKAQSAQRRRQIEVEAKKKMAWFLLFSTLTFSCLSLRSSRLCGEKWFGMNGSSSLFCFTICKNCARHAHIFLIPYVASIVGAVKRLSRKKKGRFQFPKKNKDKEFQSSCLWNKNSHYDTNKVNTTHSWTMDADLTVHRCSCLKRGRTAEWNTEKHWNALKNQIRSLRCLSVFRTEN